MKLTDFRERWKRFWCSSLIYSWSDFDDTRNDNDTTINNNLPESMKYSTGAFKTLSPSRAVTWVT